jgi:ankyrin repeat protein
MRVFRYLGLAGLGIMMFVHTHAQDIHTAASKGDTLMASEALKAGADINSVDKYGGTPLLTAARWANTDMVRFLLKHGAGVDSPRSAAGRTALLVTCAYYGGSEICRILIEAGADVNAAAADGTTALMLAATNGKADVVELLISKGADKTLRDKKGKTALDYAQSAEPSDWGKKMNPDLVVDKPKTIELLMR